MVWGSFAASGARTGSVSKLVADVDIRNLAEVAERLLRPAALRNPLRDFQRVLEVDFFQHVVWKIDAVKLPERVIRTVVVEIIVLGLEHPPVVRILFRLEGVL